MPSSAHDEVYYKRNYLTKVIARLDFLSPIPGIDSRLPPEARQAALKVYPIGEPRESVSRELAISPSGFAAQESKFTEWHFHGRDRDKTFTIVPTAIFVTYVKYEKYELLKNDFLSVLNPCLEAFEDAQPARIGLRYINNISLSEPNPLDWSAYIQQSLLSLIDFPPDKAALSRIFHNLEFSFDDFNFRYQFGIRNPDYPARIKNKAFVIDLDAYHQGNIERPEIPATLDKFHSCIQDFFERSITDSLRGTMNA